LLSFVTLGEKNMFAMGNRQRLLLFSLLACLQVSLLSVETSAQVTCRVASLDYPSEVRGGRPFTLTVIIDYSFPYGTYSLRVAVSEGGYKEDILSSDIIGGSAIVEVSGAGSRIFSIGLTAPSTAKEWSLTAYACYMGPGHARWYFLSTKGGYKSFSVLVYTRSRVWLKTSPSEVTRYAKMIGEGEYAADTTVTLKVDRIVQGPSGTRYVFLYWTVEDRRYETEAPTIRIDRRQMTATAEFKIQHELVVKSEFGDPRGSGWYDERSLATFSATSPAGFGIQHMFERWSGDSTSTSASSTIVMNSPKTVVAVWKTDYMVLIIILGAVGVSAAAIGFTAYSRKRRAAAPAAPLGVVHPEAAPTGVAAKPVPEAVPSAVKEVKEVPTPKIVPIAEVAPPLDERVYNYIVEHEGTIALSQAAKDLGVTLEELSAAIERLKSQGRLA